MGAFKNVTSKYLMNQMDFNKQNITIFFKDTWQKYSGDYSKIQGD